MNQYDYTNFTNKQREPGDHSDDPYYKDLYNRFIVISTIGNETKDDLIEKYVNLLEMLYERCMGADDLQDAILEERNELMDLT